MTHRIAKFNAILFLIGAFSQTYIRVVGSIAISEFVIFLAAPFIFMVDFEKLRRNGFMPYFLCVFLAILGCILSSVANASPFPCFVRGFASVYALFAVPVILHRYISRDMSGFRWFIVGLAISCLISLFGFHSGVEAAEVERLGGGIEDSELYFFRHFGALFAMCYEGWYLQLPTWITCCLMALPAVVTILNTSTGRSAVGLIAISILMVIFVKKQPSRMRNAGRHIFLLGVLVVVFASIIATVYKYAAQKGLLNERAQSKYAAQTKSGTGIKGLIMNGRGVCFAGLIAAMDKPVFGHGPWAADDGRYWSKYLREYGDFEDYQAAEKRMRRNEAFLIPTHSHIVGFWVWYGILGVPIWIYVLAKLIENFRRYSYAVPQWFVILVAALPNLIWTILFSPFSTRMPMCFIITLLHLSIAVGKGRLSLPQDMQDEVIKAVKR